MTNFSTYSKSNVNKKSQSGYIFLLYLSFVWLTFFTSTNSIVANLTLGYGKLFLNSGNLFYEIFYILTHAVLELGILELFFRIYRHILSYKVYTFVVPNDKIKIEFRLYFILRNIIFGIINNLCFLYPFLYNAYEFFNIFTTLLIIVLFAYNIQKKYSEPIIAHFVFKNFYKPVLIYEIIMGLYYFWGVM